MQCAEVCVHVCQLGDTTLNDVQISVALNTYAFRYSLTQNGCDLAHKLREVNERGTTFTAPDPPLVVPSGGISSSPSGSSTTQSDFPRLPTLSGEATSALRNCSADR